MRKTSLHSLSSCEFCLSVTLVKMATVILAMNNEKILAMMTKKMVTSEATSSGQWRGRKVAIAPWV